MGDANDLAEDPKDPGEASRPGARRVTEADGGESEPVAPLHSEDVVGRYVIQSFLAEGGMGVVYVAFDPELGRRVALKLVKTRGGPDGYLRERLLREAQALAQLSHPNVIAVHDVGIHEDRVFIAMELIDGPSLRHWLDQPRRWRGTLDVLIAAGRGLAAAHSAGIVHRDFKPDNVIVGNEGRVCVLDFGLARAVDGAGTEPGLPNGSSPPQTGSPDLIATVTMAASIGGRSVEGSRDRLEMHLTRLGTVIGTPAYMSPEHHRGDPVTAVSDQFSFCVTAWEALYGTRPFSSKGDGLREAKEQHRIAATPRGSKVPARVRRLLLRGLSPDPGARHPSIETLLDSLVRAIGAPRRWALVALSTVAVLGMAATLAWRASPARLCTSEQARDRLFDTWSPAVAAQIERAFTGTGRAHVGDTLSRMRSAVDRYRDAWAGMYVESCVATHERRDQSAALLDLRTQCLDQRRDALRALLSLFRGTSDGEVVDHSVEAVLGLPSVRDCADVVALRAVVPLPTEHGKRAEIVAVQARLQNVRALVATGQYRSAVPGSREVVTAARRLDYAPLLAEVLHTQSSLEDDMDQLEASLATARESALAAGAARDDTMMVTALVDLMWSLGRLARFDEAEVLGTPLQAVIARAGNRLSLRAALASAMGRVLSEQGKLSLAVTTLDEAVRLREQDVGPKDLRMAAPLNNLGEALRALGRYDEAYQWYSRALAITEHELGAEHPNTGAILNNMGAARESQMKREEARALYQRSLAIAEGTFGPHHASVAISLLNLWGLEDMDGHTALAISYFERALVIQRSVVGENHPDVAMVLHNLGRTMSVLHRNQEALTKFREALAIFEATLPADHVNLAPPLGGIGEVLVTLGRAREAVPYFERALSISEKALGHDSINLGYLLDGLGGAYQAMGQFTLAVTIAERQVALYAKEGGDPTSAAQADFQLAEALWAANRDRGRALRLARSARATLTTSTGGDVPDVREALLKINAWLAIHR
jgi:eukaryotic-like serine/threonine-protein kinase